MEAKEVKKSKVSTTKKDKTEKQANMMGNDKKATFTDKQKEEYNHCLKVFGQSTKNWLEVAEAYTLLMALPKELWKNDETMKNEKRPNVGKFLRAKFDISQGRLSQLSGAYEARNQLKGIEGYETISCDALYEMNRFVKSKDNTDNMSIKAVYEAVHSIGKVCEHTVKNWRKQFKQVTNVKGNNHAQKVFMRLLQAITDVTTVNLEEVTETEMEALKKGCSDLLDRLANANIKITPPVSKKNGMDTTKESEKNQSNESTGKMVDVA